MRGELHQQIPPARGYPARIPRVQAPARPVLSGPECRMAGHPGGIPSGVQPFSITQPDYSHEHPSHSVLPPLPSPLQTSQMHPFGQYPCFFSQCPKSRQISGIREAFFCSIPKISRLFEFFPEKTQIFGYWRKKTAYMPNLQCQNPHPLPLYPYSVSMRILLRPGAAPISAAGRVPFLYLPCTGQACYSCRRKPPQAAREKSSCAPRLPVLRTNRTGSTAWYRRTAHLHTKSPPGRNPLGQFKKNPSPREQTAPSGAKPKKPRNHHETYSVTLKKDAVLTAAWTLAVLSMAAVFCQHPLYRLPEPSEPWGCCSASWSPWQDSRPSAFSTAWAKAC